MESSGGSIRATEHRMDFGGATLSGTVQSPPQKCLIWWTNLFSHIRYCEFKDKKASERPSQCNHLHQPFPAELCLNSPSHSPSNLQWSAAEFRVTEHSPLASPACCCLFKTFHCDTKIQSFPNISAKILISIFKCPHHFLKVILGTVSSNSGDSAHYKSLSS